MKTLVGSPPPEPEDDGPVYVVTNLGSADNTAAPAEMLGWQVRWGTTGSVMTNGSTITFTETINFSA